MDGAFCRADFLFTKDRPATGIGRGEAVRHGFKELIQTLKNARQNAIAFKFLIARMIYTDRLNTLFAIGGIYAAGTFGMSFADLIKFGIGLNVSADFGAFGLAWLDDRWGSKKVIWFH